MQKVIKIDNKVLAIFEDGSTYESVVSEEDFEKILKAKTDDEVLAILNPNYKEYFNSVNNAKNLKEKIRDSMLLTLDGDVIYWKSVSGLSVPQELAEAVVDAELKCDKLKLETYKNFWTLMSLNPNEACRKNLFWFLKKYGMTIARCGFFVAYRNVVSTSEEGVYTDRRSKSFRIKVGEMVTMNREDCDHNQDVTCSRGLHCSSKGWLKQNYFGDTGMACLVNPVDVVAVPPYDNYGKMRTCAYLPMKVINYDENGDIIPLDVEDGFDCSYVTKVIYEGIMGTEEDSQYKIEIPNKPEFSVESIQNTLLEIAKSCIVNREL